MDTGTARLAALLFAALAGCASPPPLYGNFLERTTLQAQSFFALDTAVQLRSSYSPAAIPLVLPDAGDPFGQALVARLRRMGFAVSEDSATELPNALTVRYAIDGFGVALYRVTLVIRRTRDDAVVSRMSRAFGKQDGVLEAAGPWTRQIAIEEEGAWTTN